MSKLSNVFPSGSPVDFKSHLLDLSQSISKLEDKLAQTKVLSDTEVKDYEEFITHVMNQIPKELEFKEKSLKQHSVKETLGVLHKKILQNIEKIRVTLKTFQSKHFHRISKLEEDLDYILEIQEKYPTLVIVQCKKLEIERELGRLTS